MLVEEEMKLLELDNAKFNSNANVQVQEKKPKPARCRKCKTDFESGNLLHKHLASCDKRKATKPTKSAVTKAVIIEPKSPEKVVRSTAISSPSTASTRRSTPQS